MTYTPKQRRRILVYIVIGVLGTYLLAAAMYFMDSPQNLLWSAVRIFGKCWTSTAYSWLVNLVLYTLFTAFGWWWLRCADLRAWLALIGVGALLTPWGLGIIELAIKHYDCHLFPR